MMYKCYDFVQKMKLFDQTYLKVANRLLACNKNKYIKCRKRKILFVSN